MGINVRTKGAEGEREVARAMNIIVLRVIAEKNLPPPIDPRTGVKVDVVQRNQNQSAVGGGDLTNTFGLSVEIKRQEALSINTWWAQCEASAQRNKEKPILIFRQNTPGGGQKKWRVIMYASLELYAAPGYNAKHMHTRVEITWDAFLQWFYHWVSDHVTYHGMPKI